MNQAVSQVTQSLREHLPEVMYESVEEAERVNRLRIDQNIAFFQANPEGIDARIDELAEEWDVDRVLQVAASAGSLLGFWFSLTKSRLWLVLPLVLSAGALHHGVTGRSPAVDVVRRLGFRTREEIESEMLALIGLRADSEVP